MLRSRNNKKMLIFRKPSLITGINGFNERNFIPVIKERLRDTRKTEWQSTLGRKSMQRM